MATRPAVRLGFAAVAGDLRYALRRMRREALWAASAILIIGLGVGASATVFSVVNALLLRPLPFADADRLVWIANGTSENLSSQTVQVANLLELREQSTALAEVAAFSPFYGPDDMRLTAPGEPERVTGVPVTENFFTFLGVKPVVGRFFTADESRWQAPKTVVLGHEIWRRRFDANPDVIGRAIVLDDQPATIVGVLPASFDFAATFTPGRPADLFIPFPLTPETNRRGNMLAPIGRLQPGIDLPRAQAEATTIGDRLERSRETMRRNRFRPRLVPLRDRISGRFDTALLVLAAAVGTLMSIVCANLSSLLLARASSRRQEMAVRTALGATRAQLIRQMLVESFALSCAGAMLGLVLASIATGVIAQLPYTTIPLLPDVRIDMNVFAFTMLASVITAVAVGLLPALHGSSVAPEGALRDHTRGAIGGARDGWLRHTIIVGEIALVCVLWIGASLLLRSLIRVLDVDLGFESAHVIAVRVDSSQPSSTRAQQNAYFDDVVRQVRAVPGVEALGLTDALPLGDNFGWRTWTASPDGPARAGEARVSPLVRMIDDGYLAAMKIPLRAGRGFAPTDGATSEPVIIINDTLARAFWPGQDPIGHIVHTSGVARRVVGVVGGVSYFAPERDSGAEMYMPLRQTGDAASVDLVIRSAIAEASLVPAVRAALARVDPRMPTVEFRTMRQLVDRSVFARRAVVWLVGGFAGLGLILASLGIYAVMAYGVSQRTQEMGLRLALGATPQALQRRILGQTIALALVGLALGLPAAWITARAMQGLLFGVLPSDFVTFAGVAGLLLAVAATAGYVPARRASYTDPMTALRNS